MLRLNYSIQQALPLLLCRFLGAAAASIGIRALADTLRGHTLLFTVFAGLMGSLGFASIVCFSVPASRILATFRPRERHPMSVIAIVLTTIL
ncbi:MAG: hypothetical protein F6K00_33540 [Leptolyngbya sp. SIOISBB]|nr:hypothetical protein [Leptolyngbya sp. SIOISBB]